MRDEERCPPAHLALLLAAALLLALIPPRVVAPLKDLLFGMLSPGLRTATGWGEELESARGLLARCFAESRRVASLEERLAELESHNRELQAAVLLLSERPATEDVLAPLATEPLLSARLVEARVLGRQARAYLAGRHLLDAGREAGATPEAWVLSPPQALVDVPAGSRGALVLTGRGVWGKVAESGRWTSSIERVTDPGYRDVVQIGHVSGGGLRRGAQGVVEGSGQALCRVRLVPATEPVSPGDLVLAAGGEGLMQQPLVYGRVVGVELPAGATYWEITMEPVLRGRLPETVAIVEPVVGREEEVAWRP